MDTLTHALSGALLGRLIARPSDPARPGPKTWQMVVAGAAAATFPDLDFVLGYVSELTYLRGHRGVTHSVVLLPLWGLLIAWLLARVPKMHAPGIDWRSFYTVVCAGIGIHILGDLITQFGTMILAPFSDRRFGWGTTFIIDLPLTGLLIAGLAASALWRRSRAPAAFGLVAVCAWVGVGAVGKSEAIDAARRHAAEQGIAAVAIDAIPRPASPFNWTAVIDDGERFHIAHLNTRRPDILEAGPDDNLIRRLSSHYRPVAMAQWQVRERFGEGGQGELREQVRAVWSAPDFAVFRWFAMFPVLDSVGGAASGACISFRDLRFETPGRDSLPFRYGLCDNGAGWALVERTMAGWRTLSGR
ncbi:metal-dependent hydrolase [Methyloversatilis sp.]|uniref:metal-dependent hydrolase n=1 Tax=Methyloversatilis sp. TaxID=2569862 RepID=UPI003F72DD2C